MTEIPLLDWLVVFALAAAWTIVRAWRDGNGVGLVFAYVFSLTALHWLAATLYLLPHYISPGYGVTAIGLREAAIGMVAFALGTEVVRPIARRRAMAVHGLSRPAAVDRRLTNLFLATGIVLYVVLFPLSAILPTMTALVSTGSMIAVVAVGLKCWSAWFSGRVGLLWLWLAATCALPVVTVVGQGFLGYGFAAMMTIFAFVANFYRPRYVVVVAGVLLTYLGLSVYVTYMRDRQEIRAVVWTGGGLGERVGQLAETFEGMEWFDLNEVEHLDRIETRLNQNYLLGASVVYLEDGSATFSNGATIAGAVLALVPRALWPNKPVVAGSGDLVTNYTGIRFMENTSVGIGHVMEAYVNFGTMGVAICLLVLGAALGYIDRSCHARLTRGQASQFLVRYLPALSLLQVGGSFSELTSSGGAALAMAFILQRAALTLPNRRGADRAPGDQVDAAVTDSGAAS